MPHGSARPGEKANDLFSLSHEVNACIDLEYPSDKHKLVTSVDFLTFIVQGLAARPATSVNTNSRLSNSGLSGWFKILETLARSFFGNARNNLGVGPA